MWVMVQKGRANAQSYYAAILNTAEELQNDIDETYYSPDGWGYDQLQWECTDEEEWTIQNYAVSDSNIIKKTLKFFPIHQPILQEQRYFYHTDHLGSSSWITDSLGMPVQFIHYQPFGEHYINYPIGSYDERYKFTGKERDTETDYDYFGARYYASICPYWLSVDPLSDKYPNLNPYSYCAWNPIMYVDPDGRNPIYSIDGDFLGTDELGIQGQAIVMDNKLFSQNMSAILSESFNLGIDFLNTCAYNYVFEHYNSLSNRPDWDGYITLSEANSWYQNGNGKPLYADLNKIDMSGIFSLGNKYIGLKKSFNLLLNSKSINAGLVYGQITLKRYPNHQVKAFSDTYNFEMHSWLNPFNWGRNIETLIGSKVAGEGTPYETHFYGTQTLKPILPWIK